MREKVSNKKKYAAVLPFSEDPYCFVVKQALRASKCLATPLVTDQAHLLANLLLETKGKIIFSGFGKSGMSARRAASLFSSLSLPSFFLHPAEAVHGDLGMMSGGDSCILLSKSGTGDELCAVAFHARRKAIPTVLISCNISPSPLSKAVDQVIYLPLEKEGCVLGLAPTTSSLIMSLFLDGVVAICASKTHMSVQSYAQNHPAGTLGRRCNVRVEDLMIVRKDVSSVLYTSCFPEIIVAMTQKNIGCCFVIDEKEKVRGIITDGDIRRACSVSDTSHLLNKTAQNIMTAFYKRTKVGQMAYAAFEYMAHHMITSLVVENEQEEVVGILRMQELVKMGF